MTVWNEHRNNALKNNFYRAKKSITVFEKIGFTISGTGKIVHLMTFSDKTKEFDDFMVDNRDVALIPKTIYDILNKIGLQVAFFDFMYENP